MTKNKFSLEWENAEDKEEVLEETNEDIFVETLAKVESWFLEEEVKRMYESVMALRNSPSIDIAIQDLMKWCYLGGYHDGIHKALERQYGKDSNRSGGSS